MKKQILFKSALSLVAAAAAGSVFAALPYNEDFESPWQEGDLITTDSQWAAGEGDASAIALGNGGQVLELKTEGATLTNTLASADASEANSAIAGGNKAVFEAEVKFVPSDNQDCGLTGGEDDTKFALFAYAPDGGPTNLVVFHGYTDPTSSLPAYTNEVIDVNGALDNDAFVKVTVKMFSADENLYFTVDLGEGAQKQSLQTQVADAFHDPSLEDAAHPLTWFMTVNGAASGLDQVSKICFKGTGKVDNLGVSTESATPPAPTTVTVTLNDGGFTPTGLTTNGGPYDITGGLPASIVVDEGTTVALTVTNGDGVTKTLGIEATDGVTNEINFTGATFDWADYLGAAVDGAYEIDNLAELKLFQLGVATNEASANASKLATVGLTFKLTADIALDAAWPGIGVQNGKDIYSTADFNAAAFQGTFDGQNHTISGFQMIGKGDNPEGLDYCGFFNSTYGATIQNLKIAYAGSLFAADTTSSTKESGATFVGVAKNSTLSNLTTVAGTVSCSKGFGGIVGYLTSGTTVDSCTNNVNMTSLANNKCGGIAMIAQGGSAVTIRNCQNNGTQTTGSSNSEYGAIVGYVGLDITIADCETTVGRFLKHENHTVTLQGVNKGDARVVSYHGAATPGLNFAIVDGNVATFVADNALAAGNTYKVMGPSATATYEFAAAGTIAFNQSLATPTYAITAPGLKLTDETVNGVTTYTAADYATVTVTITGAENTTTNWVTPATAPETLTEGESYSVTFEAITGYAFADGTTTTNFSGRAGTENIVIAAPNAVAQQSANYEVEIDGSDVTITPSAEDLAAVQAAVIAGGGTLDVTDVEAVNAALAAPIGTTGIPAWQALFLGLAPTEAGLDSFKIDSFSIGADGKVSVTLPSNVDPKTGRGVDITIKLMGSTDLVNWTFIENATGTTFADVTPASGETAKFYKVVVEYSASSSN